MAEQKVDELTTDVIKIKAVPLTKPDEKEHFELIKGEKLSEPQGDELLVELEYLSVDPYQRSRMKTWFALEGKSMISFGVAKVLKTKNEKYKVGSYVYGAFPW